MFIDRVKVHMKAGKGGDGIAAFRREKYVTYGGPSGGGDRAGGDVAFMIDGGRTTLLGLRYSRKMVVGPGGNGKIKGMHGADGVDCIIKVPRGTLVEGEKTGRILADLTRKGREEIIAKGGKGGRGNFHFKFSKNTAPQYNELGASGEEHDTMIGLKVLADAGLTSFPSVGKSALLSIVSEIKLEIAEYHLTTLALDLGMVQVPDGRNFVMAGLLGLIGGASEGEGLGHQLLRHIERCHVIIHVVDVRANDNHGSVAGYKTINDELRQYGYRLIGRPRIVFANKMDLDGVQENLKRSRKTYPEAEILEATTIITEGLESALYRTIDLLETTPQFPLYNSDASDEEAEGVLYKFESEQPVLEVHNVENGNQELSGERLECSFKISKMDNEEDFVRFTRKMRRVGIDEAPRKVGRKDGDVVTICDTQFEFIERRHTNTPLHEAWIGLIAKKQRRRNTRLKRGSCTFLSALVYPTKVCIVLYRRMITHLQTVMLNSEIKEDLTSYQCSTGSFFIG